MFALDVPELNWDVTFHYIGTHAFRYAFIFARIRAAQPRTC
jgi:hypothetical protein